MSRRFTVLMALLCVSLWLHQDLSAQQETDSRENTPVESQVQDNLAENVAESTGIEADQNEDGVDPQVREAIEKIRTHLLNLELEQALTMLEPLISNPNLSEEAKVEAWILQSQVHVAYGDLDAVEQDYRQILALRPAYRPDRTLTPKKALLRWQKVRDESVGAVELELQPWNATIYLDDRPVTLSSDKTIEMLAGEHTLRFVADGFDEEVRSLNIEAGTLLPMKVKLLPNARDVVFQTTQPGVKIYIDEKLQGETVRELGSNVAILRVEDVPLGEHVYAFRKDCFREETFTDLLDIDLMDLQPKIFRPLALSSAQGVLDIPLPDEGQLTFDGAPPAPAEGPWTMCPGSILVEWNLEGRPIWREQVEIIDGETIARTLSPRPTVVVVGADMAAAMPPSWKEYYSLEVMVDAPTDLASLDNPAAWGLLLAGRNYDLAIGTRIGAGEQSEFVFYQPTLDQVEVLGSLPEPADIPEWTIPDVGATWTEIPGEQDLWVVLSVRPNSPAAVAGLTVGRKLMATQATSPVETLPDGTWRIRMDEPGSTPKVLDLMPEPGPQWTAGSPQGAPSTLWAAWASVEARLGGASAVSARLNLAAAWLRAGRIKDAVALLNRIETSYAGVGEGAAAYLLGQAARLEGDQEAAVEAFKKAAQSLDRLGAGGVPVAPAARDHLADLGLLQF